MNATRILLGGLLAGLVLNVGEAVLHGVVLAEPTAEALAALGRTGASSAAGLTALIGITFIQGVLGIWLYALLSQQGMARVPAAVTAGLTVWVLSAVYAAVYLGAGFPNLLPAPLVWLPVIWDLVEFPLAIYIGALVYREPRGSAA
jgi:hypothetical protein